MKAIISTGGKQYLVGKDDELEVESLGDQKTVTFEPLLLIDGDQTTVGAPTVAGATVKAKVLGAERGDKVVSIRYKAKKRVHKVRGHRQALTRIKVTDITTK